MKTAYDYDLKVGQIVLHTALGGIARFVVTEVISKYECKIKFLDYDITKSDTVSQNGIYSDNPNDDEGDK